MTLWHTKQKAETTATFAFSISFEINRKIKQVDQANVPAIDKKKYGKLKNVKDPVTISQLIGKKNCLTDH